MRNIAIDVALLPPPEIEQLAMDLNASLIEGVDDPPIRLDKNPCIPHATVVMAGIEEGVVEALSEKLRKGVQELMPFETEIVETYGEENGFCGLELSKTLGILELHKRVVEAVKPFALSGITKDMFLGTDELDDFTPPYVERFFQDSSFENYFPHITIGHGRLEPPPTLKVVGTTFKVNRIAICHLGNWGTCRKVLNEVNT